MKTVSRREFLAATSAAGAAAACGTAGATLAQAVSLEDNSQDRSLQLIVPGPAGGRNDLVGRAVAGVLAKVLGEPVSIVNPEGASLGAHSAIAAASPDGRTLGLITVDIATMRWRGLTQLSHKDYTPLALVSEDPAAIHVNADGPFADVRKLLAHIRANPGRLKVSGVGRGSIWHLSTAGWLATAGLDAGAVSWVAAEGAAAALHDLARGLVDAVVCSVPEVRATPDVKTTRSLTVMARQRHLRYPEVPTLREATGLRYAASAWRGVAGPKGLPRKTAARLVCALEEAWSTNEFKDSMKQGGFRRVWSSAKDFAAFMEAEDKRLGRTVQAIGMTKA